MTGATGLQLFRVLSSGDEGESPWLNVGTFTRNRFEMIFTSEDDLKIATYKARWINRKGQTGPWGNAISQRVSTTVAVPASCSINAAA